MIISFIAIPGSGKSTQIDRLINSGRLGEAVPVSIPSLYDRRAVNVSRYLTEDEKTAVKEAAEESSLSRKQGVLAPIVLDEILFRLSLRLSDMGKNVIIDGGPRGMAQAVMFLNMLHEKDLKEYKVVELYFERNEAEQSRDRQYTRTVNNKSLSIENAIGKIMKIPNKISVYLNDTRPGIDYMKERGVRIGRFEATDTIENIHNDITGFLLD